MFSIVEHIEYLTTCHDCVVVPGWGAFIANYNSASYKEAEHALERPHRMIGFNASVSHNDGLLAQSLMRREGLNYKEAMRFIADSVATFRQQLAMDSEVSVGRLGYFRRNQGRFIEFVPFYRGNASDLFFGLANVDIRTVDELERELAVRASSDQDERPVAVVAKGHNLFSRKAGRIAASIAVLIGLGIVLSTPIIADRDRQDQASLSPTVTAPQPQQLGVTVQEGVKSEPIAVVEPQEGFAGMGNSAGKYYMVIATLRNQQELSAFKTKYPALVPYMKLLEYKGMMCVYVARSDDYGKLMSLRSELPERLRDVWIYN